MPCGGRREGVGRWRNARPACTQRPVATSCRHCGGGGVGTAAWRDGGRLWAWVSFCGVGALPHAARSSHVPPADSRCDVYPRAGAPRGHAAHHTRRLLVCAGLHLSRPLACCPASPRDGAPRGAAWRPPGDTLHAARVTRPPLCAVHAAPRDAPVRVAWTQLRVG
jgi:hypothetical protein